MQTLFTFLSGPDLCGYLPDRLWTLERTFFRDINATEYQDLMERGRRHFGHMVFRPQCGSCQECRSLRVPTATFQPDRSQRRALKANADVEVRVGEPAVTREKLDLYDRFHAFQADFKGWPDHPAKDAESYAESFVQNPFLVQEWCYYLDGSLIGVGYADRLPKAMSAIYFFYDPEHRDRSLGTFNILKLLQYAAHHDIAHVYLGYYVAECRSMAYKNRFRPNELLEVDGVWRTFLT